MTALKIQLAEAEVIHVALLHWLANSECGSEEEITFDDVQFAIGELTLKKIHAFLMKKLPPKERSRYDHPY